MGSVCAKSTNTSDIRASPTPFTQNVPVDHKYRYTKTKHIKDTTTQTEMHTDFQLQSPCALRRTVDEFRAEV